MHSCSVQIRPCRYQTAAQHVRCSPAGILHRAGKQPALSPAPRCFHGRPAWQPCQVSLGCRARRRCGTQRPGRHPQAAWTRRVGGPGHWGAPSGRQAASCRVEARWRRRCRSDWAAWANHHGMPCRPARAPCARLPPMPAWLQRPADPGSARGCPSSSQTHLQPA